MSSISVVSHFKDKDSKTLNFGKNWNISINHKSEIVLLHEIRYICTKELKCRFISKSTYVYERVIKGTNILEEIKGCNPGTKTRYGKKILTKKNI